ncbi:unnamed protein product [Fraxinus pennsylvanica]|uniref:NAB domain-containing protein n=1 Tax=Fraxinus pennsylvanica TaxID=56036 RepID=A0AAD1Z1Y1_9LAMI|nr:unnamed protein product [Fraxinus pennsylvanica]
MEKNDDQLRRFSSHSWWWDSHNRCPHSQWLHTTLSELDRTIKMILDVIEDDDGDTFAKRAEMYYGKRPQLIKMVEELHRSYRALAVKYDQQQQQQLMLKSQALLFNFHHQENTLLDSSQNQLHNVEHPSVNPASESENSNFEFELSSNTVSSSSKNPSNYKGSDHVHLISEKDTNDGFPMEKIWTQRLHLFKLLEENLSELIRRNDEKRTVINELEKENWILRNSQSTLKVKLKAKLKGCFCFQ